MQVTPITSFARLETLSSDWNRLSQGIPFRSWEWLSCWWRHYQDPAVDELFTLAVYDEHGALAGIAPWYRQKTKSGATVLRFLGSGDVCSDYLSLLAQPGSEAEVASAVARFLALHPGKHSAGQRSNSGGAWDLLELTGVGAEDQSVLHLAQQLTGLGCATHSRPAANCWRLELSASWEEYVATLSKSHRKQVRRLEQRVLDEGRVVLHTVEQEADLDHGLDILIDLHQRRRQSLGQPGCFAVQCCAAFHREVTRRLLATGQLRLHWLELSGRPIAAEYHLAGGQTLYAYQSGVDPEALEEEPGRLAVIATMRKAIADGYRVYDFLRGDEPYKAHWRAEPKPLCEIHGAASHPTARLRHGAWLVGQNVVDWARRGWRLASFK